MSRSSVPPGSHLRAMLSIGGEDARGFPFRAEGSRSFLGPLNLDAELTNSV